MIKVAAAVPAVKVADVDYNVLQVESLIAQAEGQGVEVLVLPELCLTGYTCQDLFKEQLLLDKAEEGLLVLLDFTRKLDVITIVGLPVQIGSLLYNCAAVVQSGTLVCLGSGSETSGYLSGRQSHPRHLRAYDIHHLRRCALRHRDMRGRMGAGTAE